MRDGHQRSRRAGIAVGRNGNSERRDGGHRRDSDLDLCAALIAGGVLLQAGVLVDGFFAITFVIRVRKGHGWRRRSLDAGMCNADRLGKKHCCREKAADCTTKSGTAEDH